MDKKKLEKELRKYYPDAVIQIGSEEYIAVEDVVQMLDDALENRWINKTEYWKELVKAYYVFYESKYGAKPVFAGSATKALREIIVKLKKTAEQNSIEWTEANATSALLELLTTAYEDSWIKKEYTLELINKKYPQLRDMRKPKILYWDDLKLLYCEFYKSKFNIPPDIIDKEQDGLLSLIGKLKSIAEFNKLPWTKINAERYFKKILNIAAEDDWVRERFTLVSINKEFQKLRETLKMRDALFWEPMKIKYSDFYKGKFELKPDFNSSEGKSLIGVLEKIKETADEKKVAWTKENAARYLERFLELAYEDKWVKDNFTLANIKKQFQILRDNGRAKQGDKKIGRVSESELKKFLAGE